jgi:hypothetical protein
MSRAQVQNLSRRLFVVSIGATIVVSLVLASMSRCPGQRAGLDLSGYSVSFDENFSNLDISPIGPGTRWIAHTPWNGDFGDAVFDNPGPGSAFSHGPDGLKITAYKDAKGQWHSGLLCSKSATGVGPRGFAQQYGYFEMRAKLPAGHGVWPAFWLVSAGDTGGGAPELDVIEFYGAFPANYHSNEHLWINNVDHLSRGHLVTVDKGILSSQFNDFGILIEPKMTTYYFNRVAYWSTPTLPEFRQPMAVIIDLALGGGWPISGLTDPQVMQVQYVRAYQKK